MIAVVIDIELDDCALLSFLPLHELLNCTESTKPEGSTHIVNSSRDLGQPFKGCP